MMFDRKGKWSSVLVCVRDKFYNDFMARLVYKLYVTTGKDELVPEDWELQFNLPENRYEFAPPNAEPSYNMVKGEHEMRQRGISDRYRMNIPENTDDLGGSDWEPTFAMVNNKFVTRPKKKPWE